MVTPRWINAAMMVMAQGMWVRSERTQMNQVRVWCFLLLAGVTALSAQPMARLTIAATPDGKGVMAKVHNDSAVPITAFLVSGLSGWHTEDAVTDTQFPYKEIPPGRDGGAGSPGSPDEAHIQLRAALFADGSSFGDPDWADCLINGRRDALREVDAATADLTAGTGLPLQQLIAALTAAQSREQVPAKAAVLANGQEAARLSPDGSPDLFRETSPAQKKANSLRVQADIWSNHIVYCYGYLISALKKLPPDASPADVAARVSTLAQSLNDEREAFVHLSGPDISYPTTEPGADSISGYIILVV